MSEKIVYDFESLGDELPRPPLVALRALLQAGLLVAPKGWQSLPIDVRFEIARQGVRGIVDTNEVRRIAERIPPKHIKLVPRVTDPNPDQLPEKIARSLGPSRPLSDTDWRSMRAADRAVLASLAPNTRLLVLAYEEIAVAMGKPQEGSAAHWFGSVARCEIKLSLAAVNELLSPRFLEGRALLLARVAGIRAARRATETFDLHAEAGTGHVELDWLVNPKHDAILWQAHVSTWEGAFFPAASLFAVMAASAAVFDMIRETDPSAYVSKAVVRDEDWRVGSSASRLEEATSVYTASALAAGEVGHDMLSNKATIRMAPDELPSPPIDELIAGSLSSSPPVSSPVSAPQPEAPASPDTRAKGRGSAPALQPAAMRAPAPLEAAPELERPPGIPKAAIVLLAGAVLIFVASVAILAYVLVQV